MSKPRKKGVQRLFSNILKGSVLSWIIPGIVVVGVIVLIIVVAKSFSLGNLFDLSIFKNKTKIDHIATILQAINKEAKLETVSMIEMTDNRVTKQDFLCIETVRYIGYFTVAAGIDLAEITESDLTVTNNPDGSTSVSVTLPPAKILHSTLDIQKGKTIKERELAIGALCTKGSQMDQAIKDAQDFGSDCAIKAAFEKDILGMAEKQAAEVIKGLLKKANYANVVVSSKPAVAPKETCENRVE